VETIENEIALRLLHVWSGAAGTRRKQSAAAGDDRPLFVEVPAAGPPGGHPDARRPRLQALVRSLAPLMESAAGDPAVVPRAVLVQEDPTLLNAL
jgi:hypothetical protein